MMEPAEVVDGPVEKAVMEMVNDKEKDSKRIASWQVSQRITIQVNTFFHNEETRDFCFLANRLTL